MGLISALLNHAGSRYSLTLPFALVININVLHHLDHCPHLGGLLFAASVASLALLLGILPKHMLPFFEAPDMGDCHL